MKLNKDYRAELIRKINNSEHQIRQKTDELGFVKRDIEDINNKLDGTFGTLSKKETSTTVLQDKLIRLYAEKFSLEIDIRFTLDNVKKIKDMLIVNEY